MFRYFLAWLEHEYKETYQEWLDTNIAAYVAVGAPLLGTLSLRRRMDDDEEE